MKRFLSILLVAMLMVGCMATVAFATTPERTATYTFTVSGAGFTNFVGNVNVTAPVEIVSFSGVTGNRANGKFGWFDSASSNQTSVSFTVVVKLPAGEACGNYSVSASISNAYKAVFNEDGTAAPQEAVAVSISGGGSPFGHTMGAYVETTPAADCQTPAVLTATCSVCGYTHTKDGEVGEHSWGEWTVTTAATCVSEGEKSHTCSVCNLTATEGIPVDPNAHTFSTEWHKDDPNKHWHVCTNAGCNVKGNEENHDWGKGWQTTVQPTTEAEGKEERDCSVCGRHETKTVDKLTPSNPNLPVPDMGDSTPYGTYTMFAFAFVIALCAAALVLKRKFAK